MNIVEKKIEELVPYENNPRNNDDAVAPVAESIKQFGFKVPIVIDSNNVIITGHTRLLAAKQLGLKTVPCIVADDLTPEQVKAFRIADNKVGEQADWNFDKLKTEINDLGNFDWTDFGFSEFELDVIHDTVFEVPTLDRSASVEDYDPANTYVEPKQTQKEKQQAKEEQLKETIKNEIMTSSLGRIQCPCCGEFFEFQPGMIRGD